MCAHWINSNNIDRREKNNNVHSKFHDPKTDDINILLGKLANFFWPDY